METMKQLSVCRDLDKSVTCSLWYDAVLGVYAIFGKPGEPAQFEPNEERAYKLFRATMIHGTNGFGVAR